MAPRPPETLAQFEIRLRRAIDQGKTEIRFGKYHHDHVVCLGKQLELRRLELDPAEAEAYRTKHGVFMPEHAEALKKPGPILQTSPTLEDLLQRIAPMFD